MKISPAKSKVIQIALLASGLPWLISLVASLLFGNAPQIHEELHASIEMAGACIALAVAMLLLARTQRDQPSPQILWVVAGLVAMGIVDGAHALVPFGVAWSWLRHSATLVGGILFGLIWLPPPAFAMQRRRFVLSALVGLSITGSWAMLRFSEFLHLPWEPAGYSLAVKATNALGGLGFLSAALFFFRRYLRHPQREDLILAAHALLFSTAGLLSGFSHAWGANWWVWHGFRLLAYAIVLIVVCEAVSGLYRQIERHAEHLESCVQERTTELRRLADIIHSSDDAIISKTLNGVILTWNKGAERLYGYSAAEALGQSMSLVVPPELRGELHDTLRRLRNGEFIEHYETTRLHKDGRRMSVSITLSPVKDANGEITAVCAIARDTTERQRAEEQVRQLNHELEQRVLERTAQLHKSEQSVRRKLESILSPQGDLANVELADLLDLPATQALVDDIYDLIHIPIFILDLHGRPLVSAGWQEICTKFHRRHPDTCKNCQESDRELSVGVAPGEFRLYRCKNNLWDVVTPIMVGGNPVGNLFSGQFLFTDETIDYPLFREQARKCGFDEKQYLGALERIPRLSREMVAKGMAFYIKLAELLSQLSYSGIKLARSMTETSRVNAELRASVQELEAFTYSVSHDLRAPLRHISGFSKILAEEYGVALAPEAQHHLQRIQEGTQRMGLLVDDLLKLARVGRQDLRLQVSGLRPVVEEVIAELKPEYENRQVEWKIGPLPYVECDARLMKQVFQNLLSNAIKFTRPRSSALIEIGEAPEDERAIFVRDNGVGFDMKYAGKLFGVFQRLHRAEDFEGTGIGLVTVQRIVQKHGGRVWAEAVLNQGATFYFTLNSARTPFQEKSTVMAGATS